MLYNLLYRFFLVFSFHGTSELREKKWSHHRAPRTDRRITHGTVHSVSDCPYFTNSSGCYSNVNDSTPVFMFYSSYVPLARSFKSNSYSHGSPPRNKLSAYSVRCQKLLKAESGNLKIWTEHLKPFQRAMLV
jgi:hypothetical protein